VGSFEHGNEPSCSIKGDDVFDKLSDYQLSIRIVLHGVSFKSQT
jgi:hypothetical protein